MARDSAYDILIDNRGYMLARTEQLGRGGRAWQSRSASAGTARLTPTETVWGNQPSIIEAPMVWRTTHLGYGAERQLVEGRYNYGIDVDARFPEQVIPGPALGTIVANMDGNVQGFFEQDNLVFCVGGRYCVSIDSTDATVVAQDFGLGEAATDGVLFDGNAYVGMGYAESFWVRAAGDADPTVGWSQALKDFGVTITDNTETISTAFQSGELFVANGGAVPAVGAIFEVLGTGDFTGDDLETAKGAAVAAQDFFSVTNNGVGTEAIAYLGNAIGLYMGYMSVFKDRLWASVTAHEVKTVATAPKTAANWSGAYPIGDPGESITALAELADLLYIGKSDGLYALDASGRAQMLTPELRAYRKAINCAQMSAWHASLWVPHVRGFLNYQNMGEQGFLVVPATPGYDSGEDNPIRGTITAMAGDNRWLYAALYTGEDTYIVAGREAQGDERALGRMIWHPLLYLAGVHTEAMHISGLWTNPRLFFGMASGEIGYIILPRYTDNPLHDENCKYRQSGSIYYPAHTWNVPTTRKVWKSIETEADGLLLGRYLEAYYRIDRTGAWNYLGKLVVSPYHILVFPENTVGKEIEIRIDYTLADAVTPFTLRTVLVRAAERPRAVDLITVAIRCADDLPLRTGGRCNRTGAEMLTELRAVARQTEAVSLVDTVGTERTVLVLDPVEERESQQQGDLPREMLAMVNMVTFEATATAKDWVFGVYGVSKYGDGSVYY